MIMKGLNNSNQSFDGLIWMFCGDNFSCQEKKKQNHSVKKDQMETSREYLHVLKTARGKSQHR